MQLPQIETRHSCGGCTACCYVMGIRELNKPYFVSCQHQIKQGCGIYGSHPESCRDFACTWAYGLDESDEISDRPDNSGFLFTIDHDQNLGFCLDLYETRVPSEQDLSKMRSKLWKLLKKLATRVNYVRYVEYGAKIDCKFEIKPPYGDEPGHDLNWFIASKITKFLLIFIPTDIHEAGLGPAYQERIQFKVLG